MRERKGTEFIKAQSIKSGTKEKKAPRARNRTVMLNADETESVRSKLKQNLNLDDTDDGFLSPKQLGEKSKQIEEQYDNSDVFLSEEEDAKPENQNLFEPSESTLANQGQVENDEFVVPSQASYQEESDSNKSALEEPKEFEESSELIEKEVSSKSSINPNEKLSVVYSNSNSLIGFLILIEEESDSYSKYIELKKGRLIVTSIAPKGGDFILINDETVSPMHAVLRISDKNSIQILDQLSEQGTKIVKAGSGEIQELLGDKSTLEHGDVVSFGECSLKVCLIG